MNDKECPLCFGKGRRIGTDYNRDGSTLDVIVTCYKCNGSGRVKKKPNKDKPEAQDEAKL